MKLAGELKEPTTRSSGCLGDVRHLAARLRRWGLGRMALDLGLEVALVFTVLKVYNIVRNQFGSRVVAPAVAHHHAVMVIGLEQHLGIFIEQRMQHYFLQWPNFVRFWNVFYWAAHSSNTIIALLALFFVRPLLYQRARTALLLMNWIAIVGYASFPLMPPRLVPDCDTIYGGCDSSFTFVDTMDTLGGFWSWRDSALEKVSNHYAAMPSMHFGYAVWVSTAIFGLLQGGPFHPRSPILRKAMLVLVACYPASVLFCILVTANHFLLDAMCGATVVVVSYFLARRTPQFGRGAASDWGPALLWVTGPNSSIVIVPADAILDADSEGLPLLAPMGAKNGGRIASGQVAAIRSAVGIPSAFIVVAREESFASSGDETSFTDSCSEVGSSSPSFRKQSDRSVSLSAKFSNLSDKIVLLSDSNLAGGGLRNGASLQRALDAGSIVVASEHPRLIEMQGAAGPRSVRDRQGKQC